MLVLPTLHTYLSQLLSPPSIHTALLLTPEGALVSYASRTSIESCSVATFTHGSQSSFSDPTGGTPSSPRSIKSNRSSNPSTAQGSKPGSVVSIETGTEPGPPRSKDEIRMAAGLGAEVWAETRGDGEGMAESEVSSECFIIDDGYSTTTTPQLGRILVLAVEDGKASGEGTEPLLLLAVNGTMEADWDAMRLKACVLWLRWLRGSD